VRLDITTVRLFVPVPWPAAHEWTVRTQYWTTLTNVAMGYGHRLNSTKTILSSVEEEDVFGLVSAWIYRAKSVPKTLRRLF